jgi:hypothetical protein
LGIVIFLIVFTGALYLFKRKELDTDAIYTMLSLVAIIISFINYFSGNQNILFIDSNSLREWYGFAIGAAFSGVVGGLLSNYGNRVWCRFTPHGRHIGITTTFTIKI